MGLTNGALLRAAEEAGFDAILTADQSIRYQQNLTRSRVAFIVLSDNDERRVRDGIDAVRSAISAIAPGMVIWVALPE